MLADGDSFLSLPNIDFLISNRSRMFYIILLNIHSILRWVVLALLLITIVKSLAGWIKKYDYLPLDDKFALFTLIFVHIQLILGLVLYFVSPIVLRGLQDMAATMKDSVLRFWVVEHLIGMILSIALITIGRISSKKKTDSMTKHRTITIYFTLGLIVMIALIPWERL
jgi:hypothetical protein